MAKNGDEVLNQTTQSVAAETKKREGKLKYGIIGSCFFDKFQTICICLLDS